MEFFMPDGWLFYEITALWPYVIASASLLELAHIALSKTYRALVGRKLMLVLTGTFLVSTYILSTSTIIVSDTNITVRNPINPIGTAYDYQDIERVHAYFAEESLKNNLLEKSGGLFVYEIHLDGKKYEFQTPTRNENGKYAQTDSYSELEDLDKELVALNVQKVASKENYELNELDDRYKQIFLRIISLD